MTLLHYDFMICIHTVITLYRIMCGIPGTWHDYSTVNITVEEFCQRRKKKKSRT